MLLVERVAANLRPTTLRPIIGMSPWTVCLSKYSGTLSKPLAWQARKSNTAMMSCVNKKNRGASVVFRTHLLLGELGHQHVGWVMHHVNVRHNHLKTVRSDKLMHMRFGSNAPLTLQPYKTEPWPTALVRI